MIAELVSAELPGWVGDARLYRMTPPLQSHAYVAITVFPVEYGQWQNAGVEVVGCTETGGIPGDSVNCIYQSYVVSTHAEVLADIGYTEGVS